MQSSDGVAHRETPDGPIDLYYEVLGAPADPPVLLIMGLGAQLPMWPDGFCAQLVDAGYRVIRFDNRDAGLSGKLDGLKAEGAIARRLARYLFGRPSAVPYTLVDMTADAQALLDHLGIISVHVVGASMGGMIAQILAGSDPDRVASVGVIMSTTGKPFSAPPAWRVVKMALRPPGEDASEEERLAFQVRNVVVMNGPNYLPPEDDLRKRVRELAERSTYPPGLLRQFDAVLGTGSLLPYSKAITAPAVVLHGSADPMLRLRNGRAVAKAIPNARFVVIDGMGHDLPQPVWRPIADALTENFTRAGKS